MRGRCALQEAGHPEGACVLAAVPACLLWLFFGVGHAEMYLLALCESAIFAAEREILLSRFSATHHTLVLGVLVETRLG